MARERDIRRANKVLRKFRSRIGTRGSRIHREAISSNFQRQRALNELCGDCKNLRIRIMGRGIGQGVDLYCTKKHIPVEFYVRVPLEQKADCPDFTPRK